MNEEYYNHRNHRAYGTNIMSYIRDSAFGAPRAWLIRAVLGLRRTRKLLIRQRDCLFQRLRRAIRDRNELDVQNKRLKESLKERLKESVSKLEDDKRRLSRRYADYVRRVEDAIPQEARIHVSLREQVAYLAGLYLMAKRRADDDAPKGQVAYPAGIYFMAKRRAKCWADANAKLAEQVKSITEQRDQMSQRLRWAECDRDELRATNLNLRDRLKESKEAQRTLARRCESYANLAAQVKSFNAITNEAPPSTLKGATIQAGGFRFVEESIVDQFRQKCRDDVTHAEDLEAQTSRKLRLARFALRRVLHKTKATVSLIERELNED